MGVCAGAFASHSIVVLPLARVYISSSNHNTVRFVSFCFVLFRFVSLKPLHYKPWQPWFAWCYCATSEYCLLATTEQTCFLASSTHWMRMLCTTASRGHMDARGGAVIKRPGSAGA